MKSKTVTPEMWRAISHTTAVGQMNHNHNVREDLIRCGARFKFSEQDLIDAHILNPLPPIATTAAIGTLKGARRK